MCGLSHLGRSCALVNVELSSDFSLRLSIMYKIPVQAMWQLTKSNFHDLKNEGCSHLAEKYVHAFHWKLVVNSPGTPSCIKLGCYTSDWHCYCEMSLCQDRTLLRATTSSVNHNYKMYRHHSTSKE
jgi:hypothetical protein